MNETMLGNAPEWTVSELSGALKRTIESEFGFVRVRAEISGYRGPHSSGHAYFSLKDQSAKIDAVVWRTAFARLKVKPEEGLEVVVTGKITTFPGKSAYQIIVETLEPAGVGALMALIEERRKTLAAEGLFELSRKRKIPYLPVTIGVVTSPTGSVIRDILHRIADRFPRHVLVWPVRVQGETSAAEVAAAIRGFNALEPGGAIPRPDVLIVARGGGALEDLLGFSEEIVVRAAAESAIPLISAVGHETDWTLIDHAADLRAPTPTGAAEMCVPVRAELATQVQDFARREASAMLRLLDRRRADLRGTARALPSGEDLVALPRQRLDSAVTRLSHGLRTQDDQRRIGLAKLAGRLALQSPGAKIARAGARLEAFSDRLLRATVVATERRNERYATAHGRLRRLRTQFQTQTIVSGLDTASRLDARLQNTFAATLARRRARLAALDQLLASLGYRRVLARGFALVRNADGLPLHAASDVGRGASLDIEFADGHVSAVETGSARPKRGRRAPAEQGVLL